jgi:Rhs element Vgr protein
MTEERNADNSRHDVTDFELNIDGKDVSKEYQVISITTTNEANTIPSAKIMLRDGEAAAETFEVSEKDVFVPGKSIELKLGDNEQKKTVFKGIIVKHGLRAKGPQQSMLVIECRHKAFKMTLGRKNKYFENEKDSDAIETILGQYGLKGNVEATSVQHKELVQYNSTDWDFILLRAEMNGLLVLAEGDKINLKKPDTSPESQKNLLFGENLLDFDTEIDARTQWKSVKGFAWDYAGQALFEADSSSVSFSEPGNISGSTLADTGGLDVFELRHTGQILPEELKAWTDAALLKSRMAKIRGRARTKGDATLAPGSMAQLSGCGARFNGKVYVTGVRHEVAGGSWFTHIQFGLSPEWFCQKPDIAAPPAGGLTPPLHGLQIGIAVQLESDPDGEDRILVKLPIVDAQAKGVWARIATLDAGNERGAFFRPEIGDEVVVGFLNGDPRDAVVLGMLNSSAKPAPWPGKDDNHIKGWQTRSKMRFFFDDEKKIATLETPAGNKFIVSEDDKSITLQDQHGNKIIMNDAGIEIKSIKDIKMESAQNTTIKAGQNLKAEGSMNAELKAGTQLTAKGGASAEFSSGGATQLKGTLVKIN